MDIASPSTLIFENKNRRISIRGTSYQVSIPPLWASNELLKENPHVNTVILGPYLVIKPATLKTSKRETLIDIALYAIAGLAVLGEPTEKLEIAYQQLKSLKNSK